MGYFRVSQYFFTFTFYEVQEDVQFILNTYFPQHTSLLRKVSNRTRYSNRNAIFNKYKIKTYSNQFEIKLLKHLRILIKQSAAPKYLFDSISNYCHQHQVLRPSYSKIQKMISRIYNDEKLRINNK